MKKIKCRIVKFCLKFLGIFLLANIISGREIHAKQGQMLGGELGASDVDQTEYRQA